MKKIFVCAMAAIVALASCSKTEFVENSAPTPIAFKAVTRNMTKAPVIETSELDQSLGVMAFNSDGKSVYFENTVFTKVTSGTTSTWNPTTNPKYWPLDSSLDFIVYSPFDGTGATCVNNVDNTTTTEINEEARSLSVTIPDNASAQIDYMYGAEYLSGQTKTNAVAVTLNHALSLVTVNFIYDDDIVTLNTAELTDTYQSGVYTVTYYPVQQNMISWNDKGNTVSFDLKVDSNNDMFDFKANTTNCQFTSTHMVVPSTGTSIVFNYSLSGMKGNLDAKIELNDYSWIAGTHYIYNVTISPEIIKFSPTVTSWDPVENPEGI